MENITVYCTQCGNPISCEQGREFVFCTRCGYKIILTPPSEAPAEVSEPQADSAAGEAVTGEPVAAEEQPEAAQYQPAPPVQNMQPAPVAPVPVAPAPAYQPVYQPVEPKADLSLAISCYNRGDYDTADKCLSLLFDTESENSGVWFCACKVLAAKRPETPEQDLVKYVNFASECLRLSSDSPEARGHLTIEFNHMLKNAVDAMVNSRMFFEPYDGNIMSESVPSMRYQPLGKADMLYQSVYGCVCEFRSSVNPNYRDDYFRTVWNDAFYCISHIISKQLADDMNASKMFYWYKSELNSRTPGNNAYRALCDFIYGYKNTFVTMFNRVPFKDARTTIVNRIIYLDKWLLKLKYMDMRGVYVLHIPDPRQRAAIEQEMRDYKILLSRS
ncbi:hypothetical protein [Lachnoclostridium sp. MSJ-17]|uniref:hypothetical protein n=1 Tax=Lachnoclostridium sp. MSJ-17 TaxID=2841516 RepID=UPI001C0FF80F|nr:hypothetical protein [Lachnoclostridium sp. MSJ-17]MBU5461606.1 hypothetical protein [Lachnoclostridium sp. MSJ-17]